MRGFKGQRDRARDELPSLTLQAGLLALAGHGDAPRLAAGEIGRGGFGQILHQNLHPLGRVALSHRRHGGRRRRCHQAGDERHHDQARRRSASAMGSATAGQSADQTWVRHYHPP